MDTIKICPSCQKPLGPDVPMGLCPECLIKSGLPGGTEPAAPGFVPPPVEEIARLFPQLEVLGLLGQGGMGAVYKARQPTLDRLVALKILPPTVATDPGFAERFNREARALARLSHPNIVAVHDFGQAGPLNYLLMELVDGTNLRELERAGRLTPAQALAIVPQICAALQFAHNEGIVHRDIKPENLLIDQKGRVKITDFGIAKMMGVPTSQVSLTGAKDVVGTPHYMAPEQIEQPQAVDHRADIYSLGVVFYEMLTGELPLGKFQPPSRKVEMDVRLDEVVLRTLEKEPGLRYQQVGEVKTRVETIASTPPGIALPNPVAAPYPSSSDKTILPAFLLGFFFGVFGAHRFYAGKIRTGFLQLGLLLAWIPLITACALTGETFQPALGLTLAAVIIGCGVWAMIDWIIIVFKGFTDGQGRRITNWVHPDPGATPVASAPAAIPMPGRAPAQKTGLIVAPAVGLMVAGTLKVFKALKIILFLGAPVDGILNAVYSSLGLPYSMHLGWSVVLSAVMFTLIPGLVIVYGAIEMIQIRRYGWAIAAAVVSIVSCGLIALGVGVWALIVLMLAEVRQTFASANPAPSKIKWQWLLAGAAGLSLMMVLGSGLLFGSGHKHNNVPPNLGQGLSALPDVANIIDSVIGAAASAGDTRNDAADANSTNVVANADEAGAARLFTNSIPVAASGLLTIQADRGEIQLTASDETTVGIRVIRKVTRADQAEADKILREEHLAVRHDGNNVSITTVQPASLRGNFTWGWNRPNLEVRYEVTVPRAFAAHVETLGGDVRLAGMQGSVYAKTMGGELKFDGLGGPVEGQTMGGEITVEKFTGPNLQMKTMGGSILADLARAPKADCSLHTMGGDITVKLPRTAAVMIDAHTMGGEVRSDLPVQTDGRPHENSLNGSVNGGGPRVKVETYGGDIKVLGRD